MPRTHRPQLVLDMDFGIDDSMAALYLARSGRTDIVAVGTVHGNTSSAQGARNGRQLLAALGLADVPVATGAAAPLAQPVDYASAVHGEDGIGGMASVEEPPGVVGTESAAEQLVRLARSRPGELTLLATGPLTNLGLALELEPALGSLLRSVVVMGGAIAVPGNISAHSEANIRHDPEAAERVFAQLDDVVLVPLDLTTVCRVEAAELARIMAAPSTPGVDLVRGMLGQYLDFNLSDLGRPGFPLHDPTAAVIALDPGAAAYDDAPVEVELTGSVTRGMTCVDRRPVSGPSARPTVRIAMRPQVSIADEFVSVAFEGATAGG
ncbi:MAG: nucleoside hydrolase [Actinobacteria bacterium]|uniref:Unannotated protein n=1 Tax=freshwater metagenome TaxID=449393 RepID=A0A6J6PLI0_9ZZZZ|nr:nucleoside hydrolase [Actinomycetota bacterium]